jgi:hypothetical protein
VEKERAKLNSTEEALLKIKVNIELMGNDG